MSGHSKWNNIKHKKGAADAAKGRIFTKIGREIAVAVKTGGTDINSNSKLRDIITKARAANIPNDNIQRSIKKASGEMGNVNYESITYEGYGPGATAVIVETLTDNKNRTAGDVRHCFDKMGGNMGTLGCVSFMFETKGVIIFEKKAGEDEDEVMMMSLDCGAYDFNSDEECYEVLTTPDTLYAVRDALEKNGRSVLSCEIDKIPANRVTLDGDVAASFEKFYDMLDDLDDVQEIFHNADLPDDGDEE